MFRSRKRGINFLQRGFFRVPDAVTFPSGSGTIPVPLNPCAIKGLSMKCQSLRPLKATAFNESGHTAAVYTFSKSRG
jgi:hypothetical protein